MFAIPALFGLAAVALLVVWPRPGPRRAAPLAPAASGSPAAPGLPAAPVALAVSAVSLATVGLWYARPDGPGHTTFELILTAELMILVGLVARRSPPRWAAVAVPVGLVAGAVLVQPITYPAPHRGWINIAEFAFWSLAGLVGAASGLYLRGLDQRRGDAVRAARRSQRVQLAADLHDYVAHDVSAMVVQAQAARVLLGERAGEVAEVLDRIEADGTRALASMQRSIHVLRDDERRAPRPQPGLADVPDLVRRFADAGDTTVTLDMPPGIEVSGEAGNALYRVVLEGLTNVRKHAGPGADVTVAVRASGRAVTVTVENTTNRNRKTASTGIGLIGLRERVESFGGTFEAGPTGGGWRVRAELPA